MAIDSGTLEKNQWQAPAQDTFIDIVNVIYYRFILPFNMIVRFVGVRAYECKSLGGGTTISL